MIEAHVSEFFKFLFGRLSGSELLLRKELHYGGWFDERTGAPVTGHGACTVPLNTETLFCLSSACQNPTLHICLNNTDLKGRRLENIRSCNVLCLDLDREIEREEVRAIQEKYDVQLIVESSPRKYHFYWKLSNAVPLERWSKYQLALASKFNGDKALRIPTAMIRVPGFERLTKKGVKFTPKVIYRAPIVNCRPLDEGELIRKWPWLASEIAKGEKALEAERREMSKVARKLWREMRKSGVVKSANLDSISGRNIQLYWTVKDRVVNSSDGELEIMEFGAVVNRSFTEPLRADEAYRCCLSAWRRGLKIREKRAKTESRLLEDLPVHVNGNGSNGVHVTTTAGSNNFKVSTKGAVEAPKKEKKEKVKQVIPKAFRQAATKMARDVWRKDRKLAKVRLVDSIKTKHYQSFAEWFAAEWVNIGAFTAAGPVVFVRNLSKWGTPVGYASPIPKELFVGFVSAFVHEMWKLVLLRAAGRKKKAGKIPTQAAMVGLADAAWKCILIQPSTQRQASDLVVFQNGVYNLIKREFVGDDLAPAKYSHALWASFCPKTEALYREALERSANEGIGASDTIKALLSEACPRFYGYLENWFPDDALTAVSILRYFGYCCTTDHSQHKFTFFYGPTRAGKGSLCRVLCGIVGDNNYASVDYPVLEGGFSFSAMHNKLVVSVEEVEATQREHDKRMGVLKKLTGGERVTFERKYQHAFEDYFIGKFVLQSNEPLRYQDKGNAIRARMLVFGFEQTFEDTPGEDPAGVILGNSSNTESGSIATIACLMWADARSKVKPFQIEGSRALKVGTEQVTDSINIVSTSLRKYFRIQNGCACEMERFHQVLLWVAECRGIKLHEHRPGQVAQLHLIIEKEFPGAKFTKHVGRKKRTDRGKKGYMGISFLKSAFLSDFPDADTLFEDELVSK